MLRPLSLTELNGDTHLLPLSLWERAKGEGPHPHSLSRYSGGEGGEPRRTDVRTTFTWGEGELVEIFRSLGVERAAG